MNRPLLILLLGGAALTACSQGTPGTACTALAAVGPALSSPAPNSTGVPTAAGMLTLTNTAPTSSVRVTLSGSNSTSFVLGTMTNTCGPGSCTRPAFVNFSYPTLASATTYSVDYTDTSQTSCPLPISPGGSFTTQ